MFDSLTPDRSLDSLIEQVHPAVEAHTAEWELALDAYDGEGGFLDGENLWRFPRENESEWQARKRQARYHNFSATLVDYYTRKVCAEISRETTDEGLQAWWMNVDGAGTDATTFMRRNLAKALAAGHVGLLVDKTPEAPDGPRRVDERASVFVTRYLPTAILDWRLAHDEAITAVKLLEDVVSDDLIADPSNEQRVLLWDRDEWVRVTAADTDRVAIDRQEHGLGLVPLVVLRPFRSARWAFVGKPLVPASVLCAIYNRGSEQDTVLRDQAFSVFVVQLPPDADLDKAKKALGDEVGATRALFAFGPAEYQTPDMAVSETLEQHQTFLVQALYRAAHVPFDNASRDAQTAEAIRLEHEALEAVLKGVADECHRVEIALAKLYFAWTSATPEAAAAAFEAADVQIVYPDTFFEADPKAELDVLAAAIPAVQSQTFEHEAQKRIVALTAPDLDEGTRDKIHNEIDTAQPEPALPDPNALRQGAEARLQQAMNQNEAAA